MNTLIELDASWPNPNPPGGVVVSRIFLPDGSAPALGGGASDIAMTPAGGSLWNCAATINLPDAVESPYLYAQRFCGVGVAYDDGIPVRSIGELGYVYAGKFVFPPILTQISGSVTPGDNSPPIKDAISIVAGDSFDQPFSITGLDSGGWTRIEAYIKSDPRVDADDEALLFVRLSNPPDANDGLQFLRGRKATPDQRGLATLEVAESSPNTSFSLHIEPDASDIPETAEGSAYTYGVAIFAGDEKRSLAKGDCNVSIGG